MGLVKLNITDFRNIKQVSMQPGVGVNIILGENGSGKSSVLEAIHYLGLGRSFRTHLTSRVVKHGEKDFTLFSHCQQRLNDEQITTIGLKKSKNSDTELKIAGQKAERLAELPGILPLQLIHPESFTLLSSGPKLRRQFVDWGGFHVEPEFFATWAKLTRLLKQRNAILKSGKRYAELAYWDKEFAVQGTIIAQMRGRYLEQLNPIIKSALADFLPEYEFDIRYHQGWDSGIELAELLKQNFMRDQQLGYTSLGPQKADIRIRANGVPAHDILSRGQLKLAVCAMRLSQGLFLSQHSNKRCTFLIDDFSSELDDSKRKLLAQYLIESKAQVFVTAIEKSQVTALLTESCKMFHVEHGKLIEF
ncbi:DNA replication/repair protein RecF [Moritella viscosa]|uniref:DNA replication and repair protein RecF n=1 Tax=Moritella viscosa TaxID=80854 RepID=A0ABY1HFD6_9GAMM|nr:DNA replication/repair protein RecF [Moritella viscosa]SGY93418.1 DNA replication and repair protein recF [Moritella viscosa]SGZ04635.1 DNA replication and repair protein recF [Moritella viscosa]SHO26650.1 DNA replication and repair protein recF [Moritella viscosa]